jgi:hypothetical protein
MLVIFSSVPLLFTNVSLTAIFFNLKDRFKIFYGLLSFKDGALPFLKKDFFCGTKPIYLLDV